MPLCTTTMPSERWGWAFSSDGFPCVAHRVCPMAVMLVRFLFSTIEARSLIFPLHRTTSTPFFEKKAIPAESYPRYSSLFSPSRTTATAFLFPVYPIIPHITNVRSRKSEVRSKRTDLLHYPLLMTIFPPFVFLPPGLRFVNISFYTFDFRLVTFDFLFFVQPRMFFCFALLRARAPAGTSVVIVEPAPI